MIKNLLVLFLMVTLSIVVADGYGGGQEQQGPTPEQIAAQQRADALFATFSSNCNAQGIPVPANARGLCDEIGAVNPSGVCGGMSPQQALESFFAATNPTVDSCQAIISGAAIQGTTTNTLNTSCSTFYTEFLSDIADGNTANINQYAADFNHLNGRIQSEISCLNPGNNGNQTNTNNNSDPKLVRKYTEAGFVNRFLDKGLPTADKNTLKLEVRSFGVDNRFRGMSILAILRRFQQKFGNGDDGDLGNVIDFFANSIHGAEQAVQPGAEDEQAGRISANEFENGQVNNTTTFNMDTEGTLVPQGSENTLVNDFGTDSSPSNQEEGRFNNRSYGYQFNNGPMTTFVLTAGGQTYELHDFVFTSPIILDMDGDGKFEASGGEYEPHGFKGARVVEFDMNGDNFVDLVEWVGSNDGILLTYTPGQEVNGNNLFGDSSGFFDGFEKLSILDRNNDSLLSGDELATLSVWLDKNGNAKVDAGEVSAVTAHGITSISTTHNNLVSSFVQNGETKVSCDWYPCMFRVKKVNPNKK